ncbi:MAG: anti-sigma factor [Acetobacteraceae bacterium]|nr:anti-sigma factor [Acetobacteraceae bacterium]
MADPGMPQAPEEIEALAGEYVLGTLDARMAEAVRSALTTNPALRDAVAEWERRLDPLTRLARPAEPPPDAWEAIAARIAPTPPPAPALASRVAAGWRNLFGAGLAGAVIAGLGVFLLVRPPAAPPERFVAVMQSDRAAPAFMVEADRGSGIRLAAVNRQEIPEGRVMQLWGLAPGDRGPTSLGFVPRDGSRFHFDASARPPVDGMLVEISLEPPGGSPIGRPTGPVVFIGRLERLSH